MACGSKRSSRVRASLRFAVTAPGLVRAPMARCWAAGAAG